MSGIPLILAGQRVGLTRIVAAPAAMVRAPIVRMVDWLEMPLWW